MKRILFLILIYINFYEVLSQSIDTTIFNNEFEKRLMLDYKDSVEIDPIDLFLVLGYSKEKSDQIKSDLETFKSQLETYGISKKSNKRKIKEIYRKAHEFFFKKYSERAYFIDIATNGSYNCVTASALYSLLLSEYNIDYSIKETPQHVYLIADPKGGSILMESTLPGSKIINYNDRVKKDYIDYLHANKIVSKEDLRTNSIDELFEEHFSSDKSINLFQLAGIQYYNHGIFEYEDENYNEAFHNFEKARILYDANIINYMTNNTLLNLLNKENNSKEYSGNLLSKFIQLNKDNASNIKYANQYFNTIAEELVINAPDIKAFEVYFKELLSGLNDSNLIDEYSYIYHYYNGYYYYVKSDYEKAISHLILSLKINSGNLRTKQLMNEVLSKHLFNDRNHEKAIDSMDYYFELFPYLKNDNYFQRYYTYCHLRVVGQSFIIENEKRGIEYIDKFEKIITENPDYEVNEGYVETAYSMVSMYYVQNTDYDKAIRYLKSGLKIAPNAPELIKRLETIESASNELEEFVYNQNNYSLFQEDVAKDELLEDMVDKFLPGCWLAKYIIDGSESKEVLEDEEFKFIANKNMRFEMIVEDDRTAGRWAIREKSKLLYLVPDEDKNNYLVFKIIEIAEKKLSLQPYIEGERQTDMLIVMQKCK